MKQFIFKNFRNGVTYWDYTIIRSTEKFWIADNEYNGLNVLAGIAAIMRTFEDHVSQTTTYPFLEKNGVIKQQADIITELILKKWNQYVATNSEVRKELFSKTNNDWKIYYQCAIDSFKNLHFPIAKNGYGIYAIDTAKIRAR